MKFYFICITFSSMRIKWKYQCETENINMNRDKEEEIRFDWWKHVHNISWRFALKPISFIIFLPLHFYADFLLHHVNEIWVSPFYIIVFIWFIRSRKHQITLGSGKQNAHNSIEWVSVCIEFSLQTGVSMLVKWETNK